MNKSVLKQIYFFSYFIILSACTTIDVFNQRAYEQATSIKVEALTLIDKATDSYNNHKPEIDQVKLSAEKAYEYAKGRVKNEESTKQWEIMVNPDRNLLFGFLKRWDDEDTLSNAFVFEAKKIISEGFDAVIDLESGKRK